MKSFFGNRFTWFIAGMLVFSLVSCSIFSPSAKLERKQAAVTKIENQIQDNKDEIIEKAKVFSKGTDIAISLETNKSKYIEVAKEFSSRTVAVLGEPKLEDVNNLKDIIAKLTSDQKDLIAKGRNLLEVTDKEVYKLQEDKKELENKLEKKETEYKTVAQSAAALGDKWYRLKTYFWWGIWIIGIGLFCGILASVLPAPYNSIASLIAMPIGLIFKIFHNLIPSVKTFAGVVHQDYKTATEDLVTVVDKLKKANPDIHNQISAEVYNNTDSTTSARVINQTKNELGLVS